MQRPQVLEGRLDVPIGVKRVWPPLVALHTREVGVDSIVHLVAEIHPSRRPSILEVLLNNGIPMQHCRRVWTGLGGGLELDAAFLLLCTSRFLYLAFLTSFCSLDSVSASSSSSSSSWSKSLPLSFSDSFLEPLSESESESESELDLLESLLFFLCLLPFLPKSESEEVESEVGLELEPSLCVVAAPVFPSRQPVSSWRTPYSAWQPPYQRCSRPSSRPGSR